VRAGAGRSSSPTPTVPVLVHLSSLAGSFSRTTSGPGWARVNPNHAKFQISETPSVDSTAFLLVYRSSLAGSCSLTT